MAKTKKSKINTEALAKVAHRIGLVTMSAALTLSVLEIPDEAKRAILPNQPAPAWADSGEKSNDSNTIRREREETAPHFISYSEVQRTPARSGTGRG